MCLEDASGEALVAPCSCSGSLQWAHSACVQTWINNKVCFAVHGACRGVSCMKAASQLLGCHLRIDDMPATKLLNTSCVSIWMSRRLITLKSILPSFCERAHLRSSLCMVQESEWAGAGRQAVRDMPAALQGALQGPSQQARACSGRARSRRAQGRHAHAAVAGADGDVTQI